MSAPHDPWVNVRTFDVSTYGDCRMERDYYGDITSEQTHQRGECAWVDEVDAARAADAAEIATLRATVDQQQARIAELETDLMNQIDNSVALAHTVQAREARITELETALKDLLIAVTFAHTVEFTPENHCWEARVPVAFVEQARQALETP